jgi:hypothetical protein
MYENLFEIERHTTVIGAALVSCTPIRSEKIVSISTGQILVTTWGHLRALVRAAVPSILVLVNRQPGRSLSARLSPVSQAVEELS